MGFEFRALEFWGLVFCVLGWCTVMEWGPWCISNGSRHLNNLRCVHCKTTMHVQRPMPLIINPKIKISLYLTLALALGAPALGNLAACRCFPHLLVQWMLHLLHQLLVQWMMHLLPQCPSPWNLTKPWIKVINKPMWGCTDPCQWKLSPTPFPQSLLTHTLTTTSHDMPGSEVAPGQHIMGL